MKKWKVTLIVLASLLLIITLYILIKAVTVTDNGIDSDEDRQIFLQIKSIMERDSLKSIVYLTNNSADIKRDMSYNIRFAIKNIYQNETHIFKYDINANDISENCSISLNEAENYIKIGKTKTISINKDDIVEGVFMMKIPLNSSTCQIIYDIEITDLNTNQDYDNQTIKINIL